MHRGDAAHFKVNDYADCNYWRCLSFSGRFNLASNA